MKYLIIFIIVILLLFSIIFRIIFFHPGNTLKYTFKDLYHYIRYKGYNIPTAGRIYVFTGLFGHGKTLSAVKFTIDQYNRYNDKKVYLRQNDKMVEKLQKIVIYSNVEMNVPYIPFTSFQQLVDWTESQKNFDPDSNTLTYAIFLIDEAAVQLNSREFKSNGLNGYVLNSLMCCRHYRIHSLIMCAQRFQNIDKLMRDVTTYVIECRKRWRFMIWSIFDAWQMENCTNPATLAPASRKGFLIEDRHFAAYNTLATVESLIKAAKEGQILSEEEILQLQFANIDPDLVDSKKSRHFKNSQRKKRG